MYRYFQQYCFSVAAEIFTPTCGWYHCPQTQFSTVFVPLQNHFHFRLFFIFQNLSIIFEMNILLIILRKDWSSIILKWGLNIVRYEVAVLGVYLLMSLDRWSPLFFLPVLSKGNFFYYFQRPAPIWRRQQHTMCGFIRYFMGYLGFIG